MEKRHGDDRHEPEIVYSRSIKAGKRIYYLDVKKSKNSDLYICMTESKKKMQGEAEAPSFEKHKLFLYKEDFSHFVEGLEDVISFVKQQVGEIEDREEWTPRYDAQEVAGEPEAPVAAEVEAEEPAVAEPVAAEPAKRRFGFFRRG